MRLSPIQKDQLPEWKVMREAIYPTLDDEYHDREMEQLLVSRDWFCYFLTDDEGRTLGLVELSSRNIVDGCLSSPVAYIEGLYLKEQYRGRGLGKEALGLVMAWCRERGFSELATDAELRNVRAQEFYKAFGFEETDRVVEFRIDVR